MRDFHLPGRSPVYSTHGMAATAMPAATLTALDVLRAGGNAMDAAVAAIAVCGVIEPQSTGIGGDCFCLWAPKGTDAIVALNGSGRACAASTIDWFEERGITELENTSPHTVTIPGAVSAWELLLAKYGTKGLDEVLQPAIRFAEDGWPVHSRVASDWQKLEGKLRKNGAEAFLPNGAAPQAGDLFVHIAIRPHEIFQRDGANIFCRVPLPMTQAALGGEVEVPAIDGTRAKVKIPAGTQTGDQFRLRGKGFSVLRSAARGDMYIQVAVETPRELTKRQRELLQEFETEAHAKGSPEADGFFAKVAKFFEGGA